MQRRKQHNNQKQKKTLCIFLFSVSFFLLVGICTSTSLTQKPDTGFATSKGEEQIETWEAVANNFHSCNDIQ